MSLRTRLIVAFFVLSVVPLAAVTFYTYQSNEQALRVAAEREADLLAGELSQRMQLVTAQLSLRVEHLMDIQELEAALVAAESRPVTVAQPAAVTVAASDSGLNDQIARSLGAAAMLLNNVELQGMRGGGRGGGRQGFPPPGTQPSSGTGRSGQSGPAAAVGAAPAGGAGRQFDTTAQRRGDGDPRFPGDRTPGGRGRPDDPAFSKGGRGGGRGNAPPAGAPAPPSGPPKVPAVPPAQGTPPQPGTSVVPLPPPVPPGGAASGDEATQKLMIDLGPIRREMFRQIFPEGGPEAMTPEQRQRVVEEVNQRMLGIVQGIQLGAKELAKRAEEAQIAVAARTKAAQDATAAGRAKAEKSAAGPTPPPAPTPPVPPAAPESLAGTKASASASARVATSSSANKRKTSLTGNRLDVMVERDGQIVRQANAEINLPNVLATVFSTTRSDGGEVPFAVGRNGMVYARNDAERVKVESFGEVAKPTGPPNARVQDWIVVTTPDPSGSGLKLGIARPVGDSLASLRRTAARNAGLGLLFIAVALIGIVPLSGRLTRDLTTLSDGVNRIAQGDYRARVPVKAQDEIGRLATAFNQMAQDVEKHQRSAVEQERFKRELELGRQIQNEMLPHAALRLGLTEIKGVSVPAREVGGDFFNYFQLTSGQVALLVGDVSGKGVGAALLMANIQAALRTRLALGQDLSAIADAIDKDIEDNSPGPLYATLFVGILDPETRLFRYVNAGHHPQFVLRRSGGLERMESTGLPVGMLAGRGHPERTVQLSAGDLLFFYTDGFVEAESETDEMFGAERLEALLLSPSLASADDVLQWVEAGVSAFRGAREPFDDATMMAVKVG